MAASPRRGRSTIRVGDHAGLARQVAPGVGVFFGFDLVAVKQCFAGPTQRQRRDVHGEVVGAVISAIARTIVLCVCHWPSLERSS